MYALLINNSSDRAEYYVNNFVIMSATCETDSIKRCANKLRHDKLYCIVVSSNKCSHCVARLPPTSCRRHGFKV